MPLRVQLDRPHAHFTSLDHITGRVILSLTANEAVSTIVVKLEGESKTRLSGPRQQPNDRNDRTELEVHKVRARVHYVGAAWRSSADVLPHYSSCMQPPRCFRRQRSNSKRQVMPDTP